MSKSETAKEREMEYGKNMIRKVLDPRTDALTVVQFCALIDPENWEARAEMMGGDAMRSLHGEWLELAETKLRALLDN